MYINIVKNVKIFQGSRTVETWNDNHLSNAPKKSKNLSKCESLWDNGLSTGRVQKKYNSTGRSGPKTKEKSSDGSSTRSVLHIKKWSIKAEQISQ